MNFNQVGAISTLNSKLLKLIDQFIYLSSNISSTEIDVNICIGKIWTVSDRLSIIWKSYLIIKDFFQTKVRSVLLYDCTTQTNETLNEKARWKLYNNVQFSTNPGSSTPKNQLPISQPIQVRQTRDAGCCWRSKTKLISDVLWTPTHEHTSDRWSTKTSALCRHQMQSRRLAKSNEWERERESQRNGCYQHNFRLMTTGLNSEFFLLLDRLLYQS